MCAVRKQGYRFNWDRGEATFGKCFESRTVQHNTWIEGRAEAKKKNVTENLELVGRSSALELFRKHFQAVQRGWCTRWTLKCTLKTGLSCVYRSESAGQWKWILTAAKWSWFRRLMTSLKNSSCTNSYFLPLNCLQQEYHKSWSLNLQSLNLQT